MDYILIFNGLGNQMSQYALYLSKKAKGQKVDYLCRNTDHNGIELERLFGIDCRTTFSKWCMKRIRKFIITQKTFLGLQHIRHYFLQKGYSFYDEAGKYHLHTTALEEDKGIRFLHGGWHRQDYFSNVFDEVRKTYTFPPFTDARNIEIAKAAKAPNAVAIHIRKGDYMSKNLINFFGAVCSDAYYQNALSEIESRIADPHFYVFSNDVAEARRILGNRHATFIDWNKKKNSWQDMALMSQFHHIIIANSTFSWWAAWLGDADNKHVIRPPFFVHNDPSSDIFPETWQMVDNK